MDSDLITVSRGTSGSRRGRVSGARLLALAMFDSAITSLAKPRLPARFTPPERDQFSDFLWIAFPFVGTLPFAECCDYLGLDRGWAFRRVCRQIKERKATGRRGNRAMGAGRT